MEIINDYRKYTSKLELGDTNCMFKGELSVLRVLHEKGAQMPLKTFYVFDDLNKSKDCVLLKAKYNGNSLRIIDCIQIKNIVEIIASSLQIERENLEQAKKWWNLCYHRTQNGEIKYDPYYDQLYAAGGTQSLLGELRNKLDDFFCELKLESSIPFFVLGTLRYFNPFIFKIQEAGCEVDSINSNDSNDDIEHIAAFEQLRLTLASQICNDKKARMFTYTGDSVDEVQIRVGKPYVLFLPCSDIDINEIVVENITYKTFLPEACILRDYRCGGVDFMYIEICFLADVFGNTLLRTTNSKGKHSFNILRLIDKFNCCDV